MSFEYKQVYVDLSEKYKFWIYNSSDGLYYWTTPGAYANNSGELNYFYDYWQTIDSCSRRKVQAIADALGAEIVSWYMKEVTMTETYGDNYGRKHTIQYTREALITFPELPGVYYTLYDVEAEYQRYWTDLYHGVSLYLKVGDNYYFCSDSSMSFFPNGYDLSRIPTRMYTNTHFCTSFIKIIDIDGGLHIVSLRVPYDGEESGRLHEYVYTLHYYDTLTHELIDYVSYVADYGSYPLSQFDKTEPVYGYFADGSCPNARRDMKWAGTQKSIKHLSDKEALLVSIRGANKGYSVGSNSKLKTPSGTPMTSTYNKYIITSLSNGMKMFSAHIYNILYYD
jgi:hypothetical protein